jgi:hypothetical protein
MTLLQFQQALAAGAGTPTAKTFIRDITLTSLQTRLTQRITIDSNAGWFVCTRRMSDQAAGQFRFNIYPDGGQTGYSSTGLGGATDNRVKNECWFGTGNLPYIVSPPMIWPPQGNITFDIENLTSGSLTVHLVFDGFLFFPSNSNS